MIKFNFIGIIGDSGVGKSTLALTYGCAVNILSSVWKYGEELRVQHNSKYNHNGEGVVNPAVLTISV